MSAPFPGALSFRASGLRWANGFVPEGQHDSSQARSAWAAPKGLEDSAQGFNPENPQNKRFALKGRERRDYQLNLAPIAAQELERITETCYNWILPPTLLVRSIWRPFRARRSGWSVPMVETLG